MKGFKKTYEVVNYEYDSSKVSDQEVHSLIEKMEIKGFDLQDSYRIIGTEKKLVFSKR